MNSNLELPKLIILRTQVQISGKLTICYVFVFMFKMEKITLILVEGKVLFEDKICRI